MPTVKAIILIDKETMMKIVYTPQSKIFKMGNSGLLNQKFNALREDGAAWTASAVKLSGALTPLGHMIPEIRTAHRKRFKRIAA